MTGDDFFLGSVGYEWEWEVDLASSCKQELEERFKELAQEEWEISYRRSVIQRRIDLIRSELVCVLLGGSA